ncbi:hypothetical protein CANINC_002007 [Pichia inconspicua]|uniref:Uncharacterized protein n=1 Tax=Pichia inconspicua TaxID=52247 RepID=A0A4T0X288_9ASCO|nr:hypothetical protein CANINC_002007 [[Candida] inconspicua]
MEEIEDLLNALQITDNPVNDLIKQKLIETIKCIPKLNENSELLERFLNDSMVVTKRKTFEEMILILKSTTYTSKALIKVHAIMLYLHNFNSKYTPVVYKYMDYVNLLFNLPGKMDNRYCLSIFNKAKLLINGLSQFYQFPVSHAEPKRLELESMVFCDVVLTRTTSEVEYILPYNQKLKVGNAKYQIIFATFNNLKLTLKTIEDNFNSLLYEILPSIKNKQIILSRYHELSNNLSEVLVNFIDDNNLQCDELGNGDFGCSPLHYLSQTDDAEELEKLYRRAKQLTLEQALFGLIPEKEE